MNIDQIRRHLADLGGVRETQLEGLVRWDRNGRLVARQLDDTSIVIRTDFDARDVLLHTYPTTFHVSARWRRHMMVIADLAGEDAGIEQAIEAAWRLQGQ